MHGYHSVQADDPQINSPCSNYIAEDTLNPNPKTRAPISLIDPIIGRWNLAGRKKAVEFPAFG